MTVKTILKKIKYLTHRLGFHNERCRRRLFTTKNYYICLITGNKHKKLYYDKLFRTTKKE